MHKRGLSSTRRRIAALLSLALAAAAIIAFTPSLASKAVTAWTPSAMFPNELAWTVYNDTTGSAAQAWDAVANPSTGVLYTAAQGQSTGNIAVTADWSANKVYYLDQSGSSMLVTDVAANTSTTVTLPYSGFSRMLYSAAQHKVYLLNKTRASVFSYSVSGGTFVEVPLGDSNANPNDIELNDSGNQLWVSAPGASSNNSAGKVYELSTSSFGVLASATVGVQPRQIALDTAHGVAYVANRTSGTVSAVNMSTFAVSTTIDLNATASVYPNGLAYDAARQGLWYAGTHGETGLVQLANSNAIYDVNDAAYNFNHTNVLTFNDYSFVHISPSGYPLEVLNNGQVYGFDAHSKVEGLSERNYVASATMTNAAYQTAYSSSVTGTNLRSNFGLGGYHCQLISGLASTGLTLSNNCVLSGTPTVWGTQTFSIYLSGDAGDWGKSPATTMSIYIVPPPPVITTTTLPSTAVGAVYSQTVNANYGEVWALRAGDQLPTGLSLSSSTGAITGSSTAAGTWNFRVIVSNNSGAQTTFHDYSVTSTLSPPVIDPAMTWDTSSVSWYVPSVGQQSYMQMALAAGSPTANWTISAGALPTGLTLHTTSSGGYISGTTSDPAGTSYSFTIRATNSISGLYDEKTFSGTVAGSPPGNVGGAITVVAGQTIHFDSTQTLANWWTWQQQLGSQPMTFTVDTTQSDPMPAGLTLNSDGTITGAATAAAAALNPPFNGNGPGIYELHFIATNSLGTSHPYLMLTVLPTATESESFTVAEGATLNVTAPSVAPGTSIGPSSSYPWWDYRVVGSWPSWLTFDDQDYNGTGALSATPTAGSAGDYQFVAYYYDTTTYNQVTDLITIHVTGPPPTLASTTSFSATAGTASSNPIANTGGTATSWTTTGTLPTGVAVSSAGVVSTTSATPAGSYSFSVTATNSSGSSTTAVTLTVQSVPVLTSPVSLYWATATASSYTITPTGGATPFSYALTSSSVPSWLTVGSSSGVLGGTTAVSPTTYAAVVGVTNSAGTTNLTANITTLNAPVWPTVTLPTPSVGIAYSYTLPTPSGSGPFTYSATNLPAGLSLNSTTGVISGVPLTAGAASPTFSAVNTAAYAASQTGAILASALTVSTSTATTVTVLAPVYSVSSYAQYLQTSSAFSYTPTLSSGSPATSWSVTAGTLPSWLTLGASTGTVSGTAPASATTVSFTATGTNSAGSASIAYTLTVQALPTAPTLSPPAAVVGVPYSYTIPTPGGTGPFTYALNGTLPGGLSLLNGVISGTPTAPASSGTFTITVNNGLTTQNGSGAATTASTTLASTVVAPTVASTLSLTWYTTSAGSQTFASTAGSPVASWSLGSGAPSGISMIGAVLGGTPMLAGTYTFNVTASNSGGSGVTAVTMTVLSPPVVSAIPAQVASTASAYSLTIPVTGGGGPYSYALAGSSSLPSWATLNSNGTITGTPSVAGGPTSVTVNVSNTAGTTPVTFSLSSAVPVSIASTTTINAIVGQSLNTTLSPGGTGPFSYAVTSGTLPTGLTLNANGTITGPPAAPSSSTFTITVTGAIGTAATVVTYSATVAAPVLPSTLSLFATETQAFTTTYSLTGGSTPTGWTVASGAAPIGFSLSNAGVHSGTPSAGSAGTYSYTVTATNGGGISNASSVTLTVLTMPVLTPTTLMQATAGTSYTASAAVSAGSGALTYALVGTLPAGLTFNSATGQISGTPTQSSASTSSFTVTVTNQAGTTVSALFTLPVAVPAVTRSGQSAAVGANTSSQSTSTTSTSRSTTSTAATSSSAAIVLPTVTALRGSVLVPVTVPAIPGVSTTSYALASGTLPSGVTLNPTTGVISGTPTGAGGSYTVTVQAIGANGQTLSYLISLQVSSPASTGATTIVSDDGFPWLWVALVIAVLVVAGFWWFLVAKRRRKRNDQGEFAA